MSSRILTPAMIEMAQSPEGEWYVDIPRTSSRATIWGLSALGAGLLSFGVWAGTAPIDGAVITQGTFVATGQNKKVQHLEGGVIRDILVREGDVVEENEPLIRLNEIEQKATLRRLVLRRDQLAATEARLVAESRGQVVPVYPEWLIERAVDPEVRNILNNQTADIRARHQRLESEISVIERGIAALREAITGYELQREAVATQIRIISEEIADKSSLVAKGLVRKPEFLALQRTRAALEGQRGQLTSQIAEGNERIARGLEQIEHLRTVVVQSAVEKLQQVRGEMVDIEERIRAARNVLDRIEIVAPVRGIVIKLLHHTIGGVIAPGATVLELLPIDDELIIEARVMPKDIDNVQVGQEAAVRLVALNQRVTPIVSGRVTYISADAVAEQNAAPGPSGLSLRSTYVVRVELDKQEAARVPNFRSTPGMPAEVYIRTGERTFFQYLLQPFLDTFARAFRET